jgi:hypothetical protein
MTTESNKSQRTPDGPLPEGRKHRATYARDKKNGGYLVRVEGPNANAFAGREVPVNTLRGDEHAEKLKALLWSGINDGEYGGIPGTPVALYSFESRPRDDEEAAIPF